MAETIKIKRRIIITEFMDGVKDLNASDDNDIENIVLMRGAESLILNNIFKKLNETNKINDKKLFTLNKDIIIKPGG